MSFFFLVWVFKSPEMWCGRRVLHFAIFLHSHAPSPVLLSPCSPLCPRVQTSVWRQFRFWEKVDRHTRLTHSTHWSKKNVRCGSYRATEKGSRFSEIIQCRCLLGFWQVDWLCLQRRPSDSRYQPLSALSATQTRTATAAADISARWVVPFASLLNVRKYQAVFNSILSFWSPSMTLFCFSYLSLPSFCLAVCLFFILHFQTELNRWSFQCNICKHITEKCFFLLPEHTVRNIRHVVDFK